MTKNPKFKTEPLVQKRPTFASDPSAFMIQRPAWRIQLLEMADPFGWHAVAVEKLVDIRQKLANFETMTWAEILQRSNGKHHLIKIPRLCPDAQARLDAIGQGDIDAVMSLRLTGKERVFGIMDGHVMRVLWWDLDHLVCPSNLANT